MEKEGEAERELLHYWFTPQMTAWPVPMLNLSEARDYFWVFHVGLGVCSLEPCSTALSGHKQGARLKVEDPGHKPAARWDAGAAGGGLSCMSPCCSARKFLEVI